MAPGVSIRQREAAGHVGLRAGKLAVTDALALQPGELVDDHAHGFAAGLGACIGLGGDVARQEHGVQVCGRRIGETPL